MQTLKQTIDYVMRYGGHCRDCADEDGICPRDGTPCEPAPKRAVIEHTLKALEYGMSRGFIQSPFTRPVAPVEGLETLSLEMKRDYAFMKADPDGDYVTRSQAEAIIAAKDAKAEKFADEIKEAAYEAWPEASDVGSDAPDIIRQLGQERSECLTEIEDLKNKLYRSEANNTALTARVKELEQINSNLMGDDEDKPRYTTKRLKLEIARATEALETKLAAAKKALEDIAIYPHDETHHCLDNARAALEAKP